MPFYMRLTDGGVGLHAGFIPGYPASHGCVRLPYGMARELFQHVESGTPVEIISTSIQTVAQTTTHSRSPGPGLITELPQIGNHHVNNSA